METTAPEMTRAIAADLTSRLQGGERIALIGDLGSGKTTFVQGLVAALGSHERVTSPTFTVMQEYVIQDHPSIRRVVHIDFYRFSTAREAQALALEDETRSDTIVIAEWPDALPDGAYPADILVTFFWKSEMVREIEIKENV